MNRPNNRNNIYSALSNWHDYGILSQTREIFLESGDDGLGSKHAVEFIKNLTMLESLNNNPIIIHQYNIGGDQSAGFAIYDAIKASKCKILFICYGSASSMGSIIPQAVSGKGLRVTHPNTEWLIHEGSCESSWRSRWRAQLARGARPRPRALRYARCPRGARRRPPSRCSRRPQNQRFGGRRFRPR